MLTFDSRDALDTWLNAYDYKRDNRVESIYHSTEAFLGEFADEYDVSESVDDFLGWFSNDEDTVSVYYRIEEDRYYLPSELDFGDFMDKFYKL